MGAIAFVNLAIIILSTCGFISTTYGDKLAQLPDRFDNPAVAIGFGISSLIATFVVLGAVAGLSTLVLVNVLLHLNVWEMTTGIRLRKSIYLG